jgi:hypothetical protein
MINNYVVDQNELFFSMLNYVLSEQKNPNWVFKSSYIYIKDNNIPLTQPRLFVPDKLENIIDYIQDSKPYHTQIRDYTSVYVTTDIAEVTAFDAMASKITLALGPDNGGPYPWGLWDVNCNNGEPLAWESYSWDVCPPAINAIDGQTFAAASNIFGTNPLLTNSVDQFISQDDVYTIPLTYFDESKIGYSNLFPYTFSLDTINDPQTFITPYNIIGVQIGNETLIYGRDYYAEYNDDTTYTIYFYNNPITSIPNAIVWFSGGGMQNFKYNTTRTEIAYGFPKDDFVVNVDTLLPVNDVSMVLDAEWSPTTVIPLTGWGDIWDNFDASTNPVVSDAIIDAGGKLIVPWDVPQNIVYLDVALSYKENLSPETHLNFYRNSAEMAGKLVFTVNSPTLETDNIDIITVFVDPLTHPDTDILPNPILTVPPVPGVIWINGERIEYLNKTYVTDNTWELKLIRRGTAGTAPTTHLLNSLVFVERGQEVPGTFEVPNVEVWNASSLPAAPDVSTEFETDKYSSITSVPAGGLWYSITNEANFLKDKPGNSVPNMP